MWDSLKITNQMIRHVWMFISCNSQMPLYNTVNTIAIYKNEGKIVHTFMKQPFDPSTSFNDKICIDNMLSHFRLVEISKHLVQIYILKIYHVNNDYEWCHIFFLEKKKSWWIFERVNFQEIIVIQYCPIEM